MIVSWALWRALQRLWGSPATRGLLSTSLAFLVIGGLVYRFAEDLGWVDSYYLAVITLTTVGYGDITPETTFGRIFTMLYVLVGVGLIVALVGELAREVVDEFDERPRRRRRDREEGGDRLPDDDDGLADG